MSIREQIEARESDTLSPFAAKSAESRGRPCPEEPCSVRTAFQRDRDRVIHLCKAFRRLSRKTQVFIAPEGDHYRTRLSHTLEVSQISRTLARGLRLNEDLTEAIALAHDVGHTPFGHAGETSLDAAYREYDPGAHFAHHEHSLRVLDVLENDGKGLNLTYETRDGVIAHTKGDTNTTEALERDLPTTLEAMLVRISDRIAYVNHDVDDAIRAGILTPDDLPAQTRAVLGSTHGHRIETLVTDIITCSQDQPRISMSPPVVEGLDVLKDFLFEHVYTGPDGAAYEQHRVDAVIRHLYTHYAENPHLLPEGFEPAGDTVQDVARSVCDYVAGMTDNYAVNQYIDLTVPRGFAGPPT